MASPPAEAPNEAQMIAAWDLAREAQLDGLRARLALMRKDAERGVVGGATAADVAIVERLLAILAARP